MNEPVEREPGRWCLRCEHELRGGADPVGIVSTTRTRRCPECGLEFDPADPRSWRRGRRSGLERRLGECGPIFGGFALVPVLLLWFAVSVPAASFGWAMLAVLLLSAYAVAWLVRFATRIGTRWRRGGPGPSAAREWRWLVGPTVIALGIATASTPLPLRVGLAFARGDLDGFREQLRAGTLSLPATAGWSRIERVRRNWLIVEDRVLADGRRGSAIVNVIDEAELAANPRFAARVRAAVGDPGSMVRPGSVPSRGQRVLEAVRFEVAGAGFLDTGWWGWIEDGPAELRGLDQSWRRISGDWYAMRETW